MKCKEDSLRPNFYFQQRVAPRATIIMLDPFYKKSSQK